MLLNRRTILGLTLAGLVLTLSGSIRAGEKKDIVETAVAAGQFKTLAAALQAADLVDALKGKGPFTVFAPTDEAFAKLPKGTVEGLLKPEAEGHLDWNSYVSRRARSRRCREGCETVECDNTQRSTASTSR